MFQENKQKRAPMQIVGIVVIFILAVLIILTFVLFGIFKDQNSAPKLFGYRVYVVDNDRMEPRIPKGAAVFVNEGSLPNPGSQSVILCRIDDQLWVIGYVGTELTENGGVSYLVKYDNATDDKTWGISQSDIIGVAETYDSFFGWLIRFASSKAGMMIIVIIPCLLIIIYEVAMLILSGSGKVRRTRKPSESRSQSSDTKIKPVFDIKDTIIKSVGGGPDEEDIPPEREDIQAPVDVAKEERYVEKQLRKANDKLSTTILESTGVVEAEEISLEPIKVEPEAVIRRSSEPTVSSSPAPAPRAEEKPLSLGDLSASRIDELIKLLEEEKKRLDDK